MKRLLIFVVAALFCGPASAQSSPPKPAAAASSTAQPCVPAEPEAGPSGDPVYTGCQIKALGGTFPKLLSAPKEPDLSKLYQQGIQGEIVFDLVVGKDGLPHNITVKVSSRSPELDAIGLDLVNRSIFTPATDREGKTIDARAVYPTYFWKDSMAKDEFTKKKCGQFLIDTGWHAANFPEEKPDQYRGWLLARGMILMSAMKNGRRSDLPKYSEVLEFCKNHPDELFFSAIFKKP